ncbi:MAG: hypothetical protein H6772_02600 [Pseudomonadales bacterium]|nr:hypothetical protein [Pseudomonadales bacterium]
MNQESQDFLPGDNDKNSRSNNQYSQSDNQYSDYFQNVMKPIPEEVIFEWKATSRPFKKRNKQYHTTVITIALLLSLILFFAGQILTIAVVISVVFLGYVMSTIPPHEIENKLTNYGIRTENNLYYWEELGRFWFEKKFDETLLFVEVARFPHRLTLVLGEASEDTLTEILSEVLLKQKPALTSTEKFAIWLKKKVPLDLDS